jgi:chemotaxis protein CheD
METSEIIDVGVEDIKIASGNAVLRTTLGSCIAICLYDPAVKSGGMAHILLPSFEETRNIHGSPERYADAAIPLLLYNMLSNGCKKERIYAKIVGGAEMFNTPERSAMHSIGKNNIAKVKDVLKNMDIDIKGENIGGDYSRTIFFELDTGTITIKAVKGSDVTEKVI